MLLPLLVLKGHGESVVPGIWKDRKLSKFFLVKKNGKAASLTLGAEEKDALLSSISSPAGTPIHQTQERGQTKESRHMDLSASLLFITLYLYVLFSFPYGIVVYQISKLSKRHRKEGGEGEIKGAKEKRKDILYPPHIA